MTETTPRVRTIDLEDPFVPSFAGMCELLLVRHGEQSFRDNIPLGEAVDAPLSELGWKQAQALGQRLAKARIGAVYTSPLRRAYDTATEVAKHHGLTPTVREDLREIDLWQRAPQDKGLLDLFTRDQLVAIYREVARARRHDAWPYVEDVDAFRCRVVAAIDRIAEESVGHRVVVVCHGGVINTYLSHLFGSPFDNLVAVHHTSITVVRAADTRRAVLTINDYSHVMPIQSQRNKLNA